MKAILYTKYGSPDVLQLKDVEKPTPNEDEVLIKIHAASVNAYDWHFLTADIFLICCMLVCLFILCVTMLALISWSEYV